MASRSQRSLRSKKRYGVAAATAGERPGLLGRRVEDGRRAAAPRNLSLSAGSDAKAVIARWRSTRRLADDPVEQRALELLERAGQTPERARRVHPDERLGMEQSGWSTWSVRPTSSGSVIGGIPRALTSRQRAASTRPRSAPCAGPRIMASNGRCDPQSQAPEGGNLERAGACLPDEDLETGARLGVRGERELLALADERRARERVEQRALDDAIAGDGGDPLAEGWLRGGERKETPHLHVAPPDARRAPR